MPSCFRALAALTLFASAMPSRSDESPGLDVSWTVDGAITGSALTAWGISELSKGSLAPTSCRWCSAGGLDSTVRDAVTWSNTRTAATLSDVLLFAVPVGVVAYDVLAARGSGSIQEPGKDVLVITEALAIAGVLTQTAKYAFARVRPYAYFGHSDTARDDHLSFWSGHTVVAFSAAAAGGTVARMRGYAGWPWVYAAAFTGAALTGYSRMAADRHWLTDVLASAAVGTGTGILVPWCHRLRPSTVNLRFVPTPGGLAVAGEF
jgi:membrane-associated phospholipid phosphatase